MSREIRRTTQAQDDIVRIYFSIHEKSPKGAENVFDAIERSIKNLADIPGVGRYWNSRDPRLDGLRVTTVVPYRNYLIFFRSTPRAIEVFRIVHGARQLQPLVDDIQI